MALMIIEDANAQMSVIGDTVEVTGGGSFGQTLLISNKTASISDTVLVDSLGWMKKRTITSLAGLWAQTADSAYLTTAKDIGLQNKNIFNGDSIHANWFGGSDFELGEPGSKITVDADSVLLKTATTIQNSSTALVDANTIYDYISTSATGVVFTQIETETVTNTVSETTLFGTGVGSLIFGANTLQAGDVIRCKVYGKYSNLELSGTEDVTFKIKLNSSTFVTGTLTLLGTSTDWDFQFDFDIIVQTIGASGRFILGGGALVDQRASSFADYHGLTNTATTTINTTIAQTLDITAQWSSASTDYSISTVTNTVEVLRSQR